MKSVRMEALKMKALYFFYDFEHAMAVNHGLKTTTKKVAFFFFGHLSMNKVTLIRESHVR